MSPVVQEQQRLAKLRSLRIEIDAEIHRLELDLYDRQPLERPPAPPRKRRHNAAVVRAWAIAQGYELGQRGRIPSHVIAHFERARVVPA